jgi:hypothetical protein
MHSRKFHAAVRLPSRVKKSCEISVSPSLTIDLTSLDNFLRSLGPWVQAMIEVHGRYGNIEAYDRWSIFARTMEYIWENKRVLRHGCPGEVIVKATFSQLFLHYKQCGKLDEFEAVGDRIREDLLPQVGTWRLDPADPG